ncbi:heat shock protein Hsp-12.2 [Ditylenchus destructor]|nr:heat shock protein Hsp-12.2 [Ditylenchus destructor]
MSAIPVDHDGGQWDWPLQHNDGVVNVTNTKEKFEVGLDVQFFTPNEIEHGTVTREVHRAYKLPADVDAASLKSHLSSRGVLTITAQKK